MIKETITYKDYNDQERTEDFYFNLSKAEVIEMEMQESGGLIAMLNKIIQTKDSKKLVTFFKELVLKAYGEKSPDGRRFIKNQEVVDSFAQTEAYSDLFTKLATDTDAATRFVNGIVPKIDK